MKTPFKLHNVIKRYGDREVLNIDQLSIPAEKIYTILGPNGSGKSTLLRILALLLVNDAGELEVLGEKVTWEKKAAAEIAAPDVHGNPDFLYVFGVRIL